MSSKKDSLTKIGKTAIERFPLIAKMCVLYPKSSKSFFLSLTFSPHWIMITYLIL